MKSRWTLLIIILVLIGIGVAYLSIHSASSNHTAIAPAPTPPPPSKQPTEKITLPGGQTEIVTAHEVLARITNPDTIRSFGSNIHQSSISGVYTITVQGDLLQAETQIQQKPGVVWVTLSSAPVQ